MAVEQITADQGDELIGKVGTVVNPSKGPWEGEYRITGYSLDPEDDTRVKTLKAETVEQLDRIERKDKDGRIVETVEPRPRVVVHSLNPRWFRPTVEKVEAKPSTPPPAPAPKPAPAVPAAK